MWRPLLAWVVLGCAAAPAARAGADDSDASRRPAPEVLSEAPLGAAAARPNPPVAPPPPPTAAEPSPSPPAPSPPPTAAAPDTLPDDGQVARGDDAVGPPPFRFEGSLSFVLALPFAHEGSAIASGFAATYGVGFGAIPLLLGVDVMSVNSSESATRLVPAPVGDQVYSLNESAKDRLLGFDLWLRAQPPRWPVRPYVEGFVGMKLIQSSSSLTAAGSSASDSPSDDRGWTRSYGFGAGLDFAGLIELAGALSITLGVRRLYGPRVTYRAQGSVNGQALSLPHTVASEFTSIALGIVGHYDMSEPH